jgi:beta-glucosidase-like glycosyl hydrolase
LRAKIRAGRIDNPNGPAAYVGVTKNIGSNEHRQIAREAVQKSLVILKNDKVLPLDTNSKVFVTGRPLPITSFIKTADHTWPKDAKQIPINVGDGKKGLYPYGYGLTY